MNVTTISNITSSVAEKFGSAGTRAIIMTSGSGGGRSSCDDKCEIYLLISLVVGIPLFITAAVYLRFRCRNRNEPTGTPATPVAGVFTGTPAVPFGQYPSATQDAFNQV